MMLKHLSSKPFKRLYCGIGVSASVFMLSACGGSDSSGDTVPAGPIISVSEASVVEGALDSTTPVTFTLTLAEAVDQATSVDYTTQDATATSGEDYTADTGTVNFTAGETSATVTVDVKGDDTFEVDEYFALVLSNAQGLELNESSIGKGIIADDDPADSKGYFFGTATMGITPVSDLIGLAYDNRLMLFSKTGNPNVLYDIKNMDVKGASYTATADVYVDGGITLSGINVSGETTEASVTGTVSELDSIKGSFEVSFIEESNKQVATMARLDIGPPHWNGVGYGLQVDDYKFAADKNKNEGIFIDKNDSNSITCTFDNTVGESISPIYRLNSTIRIADSCNYSDVEYSGFAAAYGELVDDTFVYAFSNGDYSQFGVLEIDKSTEE